MLKEKAKNRALMECPICRRRYEVADPEAWCAAFSHLRRKHKLKRFDASKMIEDMHTRRFAADGSWA